MTNPYQSPGTTAPSNSFKPYAKRIFFSLAFYVIIASILWVSFGASYDEGLIRIADPSVTHGKDEFGNRFAAYDRIYFIDFYIFLIANVLGYLLLLGFLTCASRVLNVFRKKAHPRSAQT